MIIICIEDKAINNRLLQHIASKRACIHYISDQLYTIYGCTKYFISVQHLKTKTVEKITNKKHTEN